MRVYQRVFSKTRLEKMQAVAGRALVPRSPSAHQSGEGGATPHSEGMIAKAKVGFIIAIKRHLESGGRRERARCTRRGYTRGGVLPSQKPERQEKCRICACKVGNFRYFPLP